MIPKPFDAIQKQDIENLVEQKVAERKTIEYKKELPGNGDEDKREFLADVSSFANSSGGDLLYGVVAQDGVPTEACGLAIEKPDPEIQRLENIIRDGLAPRVPGILMKSIQAFPRGPVILMRIPASWNSPHMVTFKNLSRFYARNSSGKYQLDVGEIRAAFALSESLPEKVRAWRVDRLAKIGAGEGAFSMESGPLLVLHLLPVTALSSGQQVDVTRLAESRGPFLPMRVSSCDHRYNFDGYVAYSMVYQKNTALSYVQVFRAGALEAVCEIGLVGSVESKSLSMGYEKMTLTSLRRYLTLLDEVGIAPPVFVMLSLLRIRGLVMGVSPEYFCDQQGFDRDAVILPPVILEGYAQHLDSLMHPVFDAVWQSAGWPRSVNYDKSGKWVGQR